MSDIVFAIYGKRKIVCDIGILPTLNNCKKTIILIFATYS